MPSRFFGVRAALAAIALSITAAYGQTPALEYTISWADRTDDRFHVRLEVDGLTAEQALYQFASTAPGTYQIMDIGRFVDDFRALDASGASIAVESVSTNQWQIADPAAVRAIEYTIAETWDTVVEEHQVYPMAGTSIESDHIMITGHAVVGYPTGMQGTPLHVHLEIPDGWEVGTALKKADDGGYAADDYDHFVDSPVLAGSLTVARTEVTGVPIEIFTYSPSGGVTSDQLLGGMSDMLAAAGEFLGELPVDRYVFLYHFGWPGPGGGALEHSYSSQYTMPDLTYNPGIGAFLTDIAAHEFLHVVTPLNIHSEIIESFNFVEPVPSRHLWLYEGVTEWGAHAMQLRSGLKDIDAYLAVTAGKIENDRANYDADFSLDRMSRTSYTDEGQAQYGNIYQRGALVAGLLDILLLDRSDGTAGLQDLLKKMMGYYGKDRAFPDCCFHDIVAAMTYPEVLEFFDRYVRSAEPLPLAEYYARLGIDMVEDENGIHFELRSDATERQLLLREAWSGGHQPQA